MTEGMTDLVGNEGSQQSTTPVRRLALLVPAAAVVFWVFGYLGWILSGFSHDYAGSTLGEARPPLPLFPATLPALVIGAVAGGLAAGLLCLTAPAASRRKAALATLGGIALALLVTVLLSVDSLDADAPAGTFVTDSRTVNGLTMVVVASAVVGWLCGSLSALKGAGLGLAVAVAAGVVPVWMPVTTSREVGLVATATLLTLALTLIGVRPATRLLWWPLALLLTWLASPVTAAVAYFQVFLRPGFRSELIPDALDAATQVFWMAGSPGRRELWPFLVAVILAAVLSVVLSVWRSGGTRRAGPESVPLR